MKRLLSLILPDNEGVTVSRRYLLAGRKAIGFQDKQLVVANPSGLEQGVNCLTADDVGATVTTSGQNLIARLNYLTVNATTAQLPPVAGELRDVTVIKNGAGTCVVSRSSSDSGSIVISGAGIGTSATISTGGQGRFLSNGTNWYRVSA